MTVFTQKNVASFVFPKCLRRLMDELDLEVKDLVRTAYVDERTVRYWLSGEKLPAERQFRDLSIALFGREFREDPRYAALHAARDQDQRTRKQKRKQKQRQKPLVTVAKPDGADFDNAQAPSKTDTSAHGHQILHPDIRHVPGFVGREDLLKGVEDALWRKGGTAALTNDATSAAVKGLGGVGKSVLAREYAWRARERYRGVWWVRAETEQTLIDDLIDLGSRLIPNLKGVPERDRALHLALDAIAAAGGDKPWLIVYDNVEKPGVISRLTPKTAAHILITSRWPRWQGHAQELPVDVFSDDVAVDFLLAERGHETREAAGRLAAALGFLPLALSHARAYCAETNLSFDDYARRLSELIQEAPEDAEYPASVFATFSLAIAKAAETCPEAEKLMEIAAFLAPERIPLDIITEEVMSKKQREKAVAALFRVSLITHDPPNKGQSSISVHKLVQGVTRAQLAGRPDDVLLRVLQLIYVALHTGPVQEHTEWMRIQRLLPHAAAILERAPDTGKSPEFIADICAVLNLYFEARGDYVAAMPYSKRALAIRKKTFGPGHPDTGLSLNNLAGLYRAQGNAAKAEPLMRRALAIAERAFGAYSPEAGFCLNNLAGVCRGQKRHEEAEQFLLRSLAIAMAHQLDHPDVGIRLHNLAELYESQGRAEAEPLYRHALEITEKVVGKDHPKTATHLNNLAGVLYKQGRYEEAEPLMQRALAINEKTLGSDHPDTCVSINNLAALYYSQDRYEEAELLLKRAIAESAPEPDHFEIGTRIINLAALYESQGRYEEAEPLYMRALAFFEQALGSNHPDTKECRGNYERFRQTMPTDL